MEWVRRPGEATYAKIGILRNGHHADLNIPGKYIKYPPKVDTISGITEELKMSIDPGFINSSLLFVDKLIRIKLLTLDDGRLSEIIASCYTFKA